MIEWVSEKISVSKHLCHRHYKFCYYKSSKYWQVLKMVRITSTHKNNDAPGKLGLNCWPFQQGFTIRVFPWVTVNTKLSKICIIWYQSLTYLFCLKDHASELFSDMFITRFLSIRTFWLQIWYLCNDIKKSKWILES